MLKTKFQIGQIKILIKCLVNNHCQVFYHINEAGKYLKDFTRYLFSGLFATVAGNFIIVGASQSSAPEEQFLIGAGFSAMGLFITIYAYAQIYKAGEELEQVDNTAE